MKGEAFTLLAAALVGLDDTDLEIVACAAAGVIAHRNDADVPSVLRYIASESCITTEDVHALLACGNAQRDQLRAAMDGFTARGIYADTE